MAANVFSSSGTISVGSFLYTNSGLTNPAPNGFYSDGTTVYAVTGGSGQITGSQTCASFTTGNCYTVTNNEAVDVSIKYFDGAGVQSCQIVNAEGFAIICIQTGQETNYTVSLGTGCTEVTLATNYTVVATGSTCGITNVCNPTTTSTTTTTTTAAP